MFEVTHKNGNVRAIVNATSADAAYRQFAESRRSQGVRPIRSNHSIVPFTLPTPGAIVFLKNTKQEDDDQL